MAVACGRFKPGRGAPNLRAAANSAHRTLHRARVWAPEGQLAHCCISAAASPLLPRGRRSACRVVQIRGSVRGYPAGYVTYRAYLNMASCTSCVNVYARPGRELLLPSWI